MSTAVTEPGRWRDYLCICLPGWEPGDFQKTHLCSGHSRSQQCYRCISGILLSSDCNCQRHWGRCCHCTGRGGRASQGRFSPEGLQSSRRHRARTFYLHMRQSAVMQERPQTFLVLLHTSNLVTKRAGEPSGGGQHDTVDRPPAPVSSGPGLQSRLGARPVEWLWAHHPFCHQKDSTCSAYCTSTVLRTSCHRAFKVLCTGVGLRPKGQRIHVCFGLWY